MCSRSSCDGLDFCDGIVSSINTQYQYPYLNTRYVKIHLTALQCNCLGSELILRVMAMLGLIPTMLYMRPPLTLKNTPFLWVKNMFIFKFLFICLQLHFFKFSVSIILDYGQHESFPKSFLFKLILKVSLQDFEHAHVLAKYKQLINAQSKKHNIFLLMVRKHNSHIGN